MSVCKVPVRNSLISLTNIVYETACKNCLPMTTVTILLLLQRCSRRICWPHGHSGILSITWPVPEKGICILDIYFCSNFNLHSSWLEKAEIVILSHVKCHNNLERTVIEGRVPGRRDRWWPMCRWALDLGEIFGIRMHEGWGKAVRQPVKSFREAMKSHSIRDLLHQAHLFSILLLLIICMLMNYKLIQIMTNL